MINCTYHGKPLLLGPQNYFKLSTGTHPSFGFFRMKAADVTYVLTTMAGAAGILVLSDGTNTVTLYNIYLVKSTSVSSLTENVCDIVLSDERILWQYKYGTVDYNTYKTDRTVGTTEFELENLNFGDEWTFNELRDALMGILNITTLNFLTPTRKPRNIIGTNIPGSCIMQQFLIDAQSYIVADYRAATPIYSIYPIGDAETGADTTLLTLYDPRLHKQHIIKLNPKVQKGLSVKMLASANPDDAPGRLLTYGLQTATGGTGAFHIPSPYAVFGDEENTSDLTTIGNEVATEYVGSFANTWRDNKYAGTLPFVLNRAIHEITWSVTAQGVFTTIKSFRPREELEGKILQDRLFSYYRYLLNKGGEGTQVRSAKIQAGGIPSDAVGPFTCKLLDSDGNETGNDIDVYPREHLGTNTFDSGDVHPNLAAADTISIFKDEDDKWYMTFTFEDTIDCTCTPA